MKAVQMSAPGSLMLFGEHAVLRGKLALVCAINKRMHVSLEPREDNKICLHSILGEHETTLEDLAPADAFRFVLAAIRVHKKTYATGFDLHIRSDFSHQMGLGSSAAVTVATLAALEAALGRPLNTKKLAERGVRIIQDVQGLGSGADVAASVMGGVLAYRADPLEITPVATACPLTVLYSGSKKPTVEVVKLVEETRKAFGDVYDALDALSEQITNQAAQRLAAQDWAGLGQLMNFNQGILDAMGVNNEVLSELIYLLRSDPGIHGSKISGSGLGDCVIGLGHAMRRDWGHPSLAVEPEARGVSREHAA